MKAGKCADVSLQRPYISKENSTTPSVSIEALFITIAVDAHQEKYVTTSNIARSYIYADIERFNTLQLEGDMVDLVVEVNPEKYAKYVRHGTGKKVLYLRLLKALYGCIQSDLFWYNLFTSTLESECFALNPYDLCVSNKDINGK